MADAPGKDNLTDPKPSSKIGPVKPPVLEGTARATAKPAESVPPKKDKPEPAIKPSKAPSIVKRDDDEGNGSPWLAGVLGGALGLGAAYGLAFFGLWPTTPVAPAPADPRLAQFASAIPELQTVTGTVQDELSTLNGRVSGLESTLAEQPETASAGPDFSEDIAALSARLDALAITPASEAEAPDAGAIDDLRSEIAALQQQLAESQSRIEQTETDIVTLTESATTEQTSGSNAARLPLIFSGLESAFNSGRSFEDELTALGAAAPQADIPAAISQGAANGLPRPDDVARRLDAALPDMLAGRPVAADAGWQDATADWFRGVIAMRPAGDVEGSTPDAIIARLEAAVARRDFVAAEQEFNALPQAMQSAAGGLGGDIAALAAASTLLQELRSDALGRGDSQ